MVTMIVLLSRRHGSWIFCPTQQPSIKASAGTEDEAESQSQSLAPSPTPDASQAPNAQQRTVWTVLNRPLPTYALQHYFSSTCGAVQVNFFISLPLSLAGACCCLLLPSCAKSHSPQLPFQLCIIAASSSRISQPWTLIISSETLI